jgi:membrane-anchored protein YejM (alkaline phosphatase superfamily)
MEPSEDTERVNYFYFGILFILLLVTATSSIFLKQNLAGSRMFFWFYAVGQMTLEVAFLAFLGREVRRFLGKKGFALFVALTFLLFVIHLLDFVLDRILDLTFFEAVYAFLLDEKLDNFLLLLDASGLPMGAWLLIFAVGAALPLFGLAFYAGTAWLARQQPIRVQEEVFLQLFVCIPAALFYWDVSASRMIHPDSYNEFVKSLPWKRTLFQPATIQLATGGALYRPPGEAEVREQIDALSLSRSQTPNIYLFIVESLRSDFINHEIAPHIARFGDENLSAQLSLSNANWTNISWFSIFHSQFPFYWVHRQQENWSLGSPALHVLRKLGYKIRVYTSAQLAFYGSDQLLFGANHALVDSYQTFPHASSKSAWQSDAATLQQFQADLAADPSLEQGQLVIFFWDSTHFDYSWPETAEAQFRPYANEIAFFSTYPTPNNLKKIQNRYKNAVHYVDQLFGNFIERLPADAWVVITGDHGEEFYDHGHLFHGSHLAQAQIAVPIYMRVGSVRKQVPLLSQMDIFPTVLDALTGREFPFLEGESALRERRWPYVASARFNARRAPYEFALQNGRSKLIAQLNHRDDIFHSDGLTLVSLRSHLDRTLIELGESGPAWAAAEFGSAFSRLFVPHTN